MILLATAAWATVELEMLPESGVETVVVVKDERGDPRGGETVRVVHRPGLSGEQEQAIGITDGRGRVRWTPRDAGVAWLRAGDELQPVRVGGLAAGPVLPFLVGLLVVGGVGALGYGARRTRR